MRVAKLLPLVAAGGLAVLYAASAGGIHWTAPANWKTEAARPMRAATYTVGEGAECVVYYFGPGQGGSVDANLKRWVGQFQPADGKPVEGTETIHGLKVATLEVSGTYSGGMGAPGSKPHYRLLGAIVEAPEGPVFFKFTGPEKVVTAHQREFRSMLATVAK